MNAGYICGGSLGKYDYATTSIKIDTVTDTNKVIAASMRSGTPSLAFSSNNNGYIYYANSKLDCFIYTTETVNPLVIALVNRKDGCGTNSEHVGYLVCGYELSCLSSIESMDFINQNVQEKLIGLQYHRRGLASVHSQSNGYFTGGSHGNRYIEYTEKYDFTTETKQTLYSSKNRNNLSSFSSHTGYFLGGYDKVKTLNTISKLNFQTEATEESSSKLSLEKTSVSSVCSTIKGYACGGFNKQLLNAVDIISVSNDCVTNAILPYNVSKASGIHIPIFYEDYTPTEYIPKEYSPEELKIINKTNDEFDGFIEDSVEPEIQHSFDNTPLVENKKGYICGGLSFSLHDSIEKLPFNTELCVNTNHKLSENKYGCSGVQSDCYGYVLGGSSLLGAIHGIESINFATDSSSSIKARLLIDKSHSGSLSSKIKGYACGGMLHDIVNTASILIFNTETSDTHRHSLCLYANQSGIFSASKGYLSGGFNLKKQCSKDIINLEFSNDAFGNTASALTEQFTSCGINGFTGGYFYGTTANKTSMEAFNFNTEVSNTVNISINGSFDFMSANSSRECGYICGGASNSIFTSAISKYAISANTLTDLQTGLHEQKSETSSTDSQI